MEFCNFLYRWYYLHWWRDSVSPVCRIFSSGYNPVKPCKPCKMSMLIAASDWIVCYWGSNIGAAVPLWKSTGMAQHKWQELWPFPRKYLIFYTRYSIIISSSVTIHPVPKWRGSQKSIMVRIVRAHYILLYIRYYKIVCLTVFQNNNKSSKTKAIDC